ncbi:hypothetical protein CFBP6626_15240 [Agrobacterium tumefaciens]|nr:hypothetical protein CFBP6626_15240 [Agrobacterium tumefaciens]CUX48983.1 conserved hypothetical protein [Agrobacterium genomosp. 5 str. CFBP 6626]
MPEIDEEFDAFVDRVLEKDSPFEPPPELQLRPSQWKKALSDLYQVIEAHLDRQVRRGAIRIKYKETELDERYLGSYSAQTMVIEIGRQKVDLVPIGTLIIGGRGRVDVKGPFGDARLVLVHKDVRRPEDLIKVKINDTRRGRRKISVENEGDFDDFAWKIATPPPRVVFDALTETSFHAMLMEVLNA